MSLKKFLISRIFLLNLFIAIVIVAGVALLTLNRLKTYTHHGISYEVPNFTGMSIAEAQKVAQQNKIEVELIDSIYNKEVAPGAIVDQVPYAHKRVKEGRVIYLTINSTEAEKVTLPKLTDISFRQARVLLERCGLILDSISYQPSEYNDLVLKVQQDSMEVFQGDQLTKGSMVDLIVGQSKGNMETNLPDLMSMFMDDAKATLESARLNLGVVIYDNTIETKDDSLNARIWRQIPNAELVSKVRLGSSVDVWLTIDNKKLEKDTEQ